MAIPVDFEIQQTIDVNYRKVISDADIKNLRARNDQRVEEAKRLLGEIYLCHPANKIVRKHAKAFK